MRDDIEALRHDQMIEAINNQQAQTAQLEETMKEVDRNTQRRQFAMAALQGILANPQTAKDALENGLSDEFLMDVIVGHCFRYADRMLALMEKPDEKERLARDEDAAADAFDERKRAGK